MEPLISVLIPVYGVEQYIEKCLKSLFENTIADKCEFIIVNDCTKDKSMIIAQKLISEYKNLNVKIINHEKNSGLASARNTGLKNASGKYIICTDSDDWVEKDYLEKMYHAAEEKQADVTICNWYVEKETVTLMKSQEQYNAEEFFEAFLQCKVQAFVWNKLIKRSLFEDNNFTWEDGINNWEDETICIKLFSEAKSYAYVESYLYHYRVRNGSYIRCLITEKTKQDFMNAISKMDSFLSSPKFNTCRNLINYKKIHVKQKLLIDGTRYMQKKYLSLWPETYTYIKKDNTLLFREKLILKTAKMLPPFSLLLLFMLSTLKIIMKKQFTWKQYFGKNENQ